MHFGAFLDPAWRVNDILWGRLDGAERLIRIVLSGQPASTVDGLVKDAQNAILEEHAAAATRPRVEALVAGELGAAGETRQKERDRAVRIVDRLQMAGALNMSSVSSGPLWNRLASFDARKVEIDRERLLEVAARGSVVFGKILEGLADKYRRGQSAAAMVTRAGQFFWVFVEMAIPRSVPSAFAGHWSRLLALAAVLLLILGILFSRPWATAGAVALGLLLALQLLLGIVRDYTTRRAKWKWVLATAVMLMVGALAINGALHLPPWIRTSSGWFEKLPFPVFGRDQRTPKKGDEP
jgi:hypothetical protein